MGVNSKKKKGDHVPVVIDDSGVEEPSTQGVQAGFCGAVPGARTLPYKTAGF
jgi:hypothetical protein